MAKKKTNEIDRRMFKKEGEELQQYLHFRKRGSKVQNKKGKGSYKRNKKWGDEQWHDARIAVAPHSRKW